MGSSSRGPQGCICTTGRSGSFWISSLGYGSVGLGDNHPRILAARTRFAAEKRPEFAKSFLSPYAAALAANLARLSPEDLGMVYVGSSGAEAVEAALKLAEQIQGPKRSRILYAENSFRGRTRGALSVTRSVPGTETVAANPCRRLLGLRGTLMNEMPAGLSVV